MERMCENNNNCINCQIGINAESEEMSCSEYMAKYPVYSESIINLWNKNHPSDIDEAYWRGVRDMADFISIYLEYPDLYNDADKVMELFMKETKTED